MKSIKPTIVFFLLFISFFPMQAQLLKKLKKAVEQRLEDHAVNQAEKGVDKGVEKTEEVIWKSISREKNKEKADKNIEDQLITESETGEASYNQEEIQNSIMNMMGGSGEKVETAEAYSFNKKVVYDMTTNVKGDPSSMKYILLLNPDQKYIGYQMGEISSKGKKTKIPMEFTMIIDYDHSASIMIMEDQKMAQVTSMETLESVVENEEAKTQNAIVKTGNTKDLLGYRCEEYQIKSEDIECSIWIAPDIEIYNQSFLKDFSNSAFALRSELMKMTGLTMEMDMASYSGNSKKPMEMNMKVVSLEDEQNEIEMSNYKSLNLGSAFMQK